MDKTKGKLYLIPSLLGDTEPSDVLPEAVLTLLPNIKCFVVEEIKTARRFLSRAGLKGHIEELEFHELNEHTTPREVEELGMLFDDGRDVGLISEAGLPAVADPGRELVALAHKKGIRVIPMVGPSSLMLALMASGLNGQSFAFRGYLGAKSDERKKDLRSVEKISRDMNQTQIIIETPYRNDSFFSDALEICAPSTRITVACNITLPDEMILTKTVEQWRRSAPLIGKRPCVFLILASR